MSENHSRHITGYRELSEGDIANMNSIKDVAMLTGHMIKKLRALPDVDQHWIDLAEIKLQFGFMAATRAVAKPTTF